MKKLSCYLLVLSLLLSFLSGCSVSEDKTINATTPLPVINSDSNDKIDVDLSTLSSTMVYGEVSQMMYEPDLYVGKTIKMRGQYAVYHDEANQLYYHAVIIADATSCCAQGLEFKWLGEHKYPDEYPKEDAEIEVVGVYKSYEEDDGQIYFYVETDNIKIL